jgi:hypothetical protein
MYDRNNGTDFLRPTSLQVELLESCEISRFVGALQIFQNNVVKQLFKTFSCFSQRLFLFKNKFAKITKCQFFEDL